MSTSEPIETDMLRQWIGREQEGNDAITPRLLAEFNSCFAGGENIPANVPEDVNLLGLHWCLAPDAAPLESLDTDGHIARGGFLPPVPLPHRMWAGGRLVFHDQLRPGDSVTRRSSVEDINIREGRSGQLCFVTVRHVYISPRGPALTERRDIVYRNQTANSGSELSAGNNLKKNSVPIASRKVIAGPVLLFRYSALTFNSHRIHYDVDYCREEGYPGLLVHGPLQATLLLRFGSSIRNGGAPSLFDYRATLPLFDGREFSMYAVEAGTAMEFWINDAEGNTTMTARGTW